MLARRGFRNQEQNFSPTFRTGFETVSLFDKECKKSDSSHSLPSSEILSLNVL